MIRIRAVEGFEKEDYGYSDNNTFSQQLEISLNDGWELIGSIRSIVYPNARVCHYATLKKESKNE